MPRIQEYTQQVMPQGEGGGRRASGEDFGSGIGHAVGGLVNSAINYMDVERKLEERKELSSAVAEISEVQVKRAEQFDELTKTARPGDDIVGQLRESFKSDAEQIRTKYKTRAAQDYINKHEGAMTAHYLTRGIGMQSELAAQKAYDDGEVTIQNNSQVVMKNQDMYDFVKSGMEFDFNNKEGVHKKLDYQRSSRLHEAGVKVLSWSAAMGAVENPAIRGQFSAVVSDYNSGGFDSIMSNVFKFEGGYVANDNGKGETNFGINKTFNPEVDVRNLTQDKAKAIYREKYWNAVGVDRVPADMQPLIFDAAVNQGQSYAKKLIEAIESGATKDDIIAARKLSYQTLADNNKDNEKYLKGWLDRVDKMAALTVESNKGDIDVNVDGAPSWYQDLSVEKKMQFLNMVRAREKTERVASDKTLKKIMQDHVAHMENTLELPTKPLTITDFRGDSDAFETYDTMMKATQAMASVRTASVADQNKALAALRPQESEVPGLESKQWKIYRAAETLAGKSNETRQKDPIAEASRSRLFGDKGVSAISMPNPTDFEKFFVEVNSRVPQAETTATVFGTENTYFSNKEKEGVKNAYNSFNADHKLEFIKTAKAKLPANRYEQFMKDIGSSDNPTQFVSKIDLDRGNNTAMSKIILFGRDYMEAEVRIGARGAETIAAGVKEDFSAGKKPLPNYENARKLFGEHVKGLTDFPESSIKALVDTSLAYYIGEQRIKSSSSDLSLDRKSTANHTAFKNAIDKVIGTPERFGTSEVLRPIGMDSSEFRTLIGNELANKAPDVNSSSITLQVAHKGQYLVKQGGQALIVDGKAVFLNPSLHKYKKAGAGGYLSDLMLYRPDIEGE